MYIAARLKAVIFNTSIGWIKEPTSNFNHVAFLAVSWADLLSHSGNPAKPAHEYGSAPALPIPTLSQSDESANRVERNGSHAILTF